ncbi:MAG: hypothetical protein KatS3mg043_1719 [Rhodothermaceae bacterium]|nr:MAG: hypothetical protein KatS3mg043_1719 [Rhodothermaceae bacterium]
MGRTREGCGYIALYNGASNSMDQRYMNTYPCQLRKGRGREATEG